MDGKSKCKILKDIRARIARENEIDYVTSECKFQGSCSGTCPKCEAELRYLEDELRKRRNAGKAVAVAGIAAAMVVCAAGCDLTEHNDLMGDVPYVETTQQTEDQSALTGRSAYNETTGPEELLDGEVVYEDTTEHLLTGDVAWPQ